jgi:mannose-1-phosphate guanylyltransferase
MVSLILCGGSGTRLWPLSRRQSPKQFYPLFGKRSLFESVIKRNAAFSSRFAIAANREQAFLAIEQLQGCGISDAFGVIEPVGRNTAPAIALVAFGLDPDETVLVCPSDHVVMDERGYGIAVKRAAEIAALGRIVTFGIRPTYPETGYGYIEHHGEEVISFREKPDRPMAESFVDSGNYLWNSGMFCFKAGVFLEELSKSAPALFRDCRAVFEEASRSRDAGRRGAMLEPEMESMVRIPSISVDYAVMEKSDIVSVVECDFGWNDLGSFDSLFEIAFDSTSGNSILAETKPLFIDSKENLVVAMGGKKVVLIDMRDAIVVDTEDALLVMKRGSSQRVKEAVEAIGSEGSSLVDAHSELRRAWGSVLTLHETDDVHVMRVSLLPGKRASFKGDGKQRCHWTCVEGKGKLLSGDHEYELGRGSEPLAGNGAEYAFESAGDEPLVVVETRIMDRQKADGEAG